MNLFTKQTQGLEKRIHGYWSKGWREGIVREFGMDMYTLLYLKWITDKDLLYSTENSAQCYVAAQDGREIWERMDTCIRMSELLCYAPELPQLYSNIKKKVKIRKGKT